MCAVVYTSTSVSGRVFFFKFSLKFEAQAQFVFMTFFLSSDHFSWNSSDLNSPDLLRALFSTAAVLNELRPLTLFFPGLLIQLPHIQLVYLSTTLTFELVAVHTTGECGRGGSSGCWSEHHLDSWCLYSRHQGISFPKSAGLVQDAASPLFHVHLWLRCYNESSVCLCHSLTWVNLCLGASLSSHLAPLILVCLEGNWR